MNERKKVDNTVNIQFTDEEADMIIKYQEAVDATSIKNAILNAISLALDYVD